jgi:hypothetical protein
MQVRFYFIRGIREGARMTGKSILHLWTFGAGILALGAATPVLAEEVQTYTYDAKGRLIVKKSTGDVNHNETRSYCYDKAGNRITYNANQTGVPHACVTDGTE